MNMTHSDRNKRRLRYGGFTLIELSIVLVVIGLLVGGVLVGRDLIIAVQVRAQISQIEKYQQAVNTFKGKYGQLPGDLSVNDANQFGFVARAGTAGRGDGNGLIEGYNYAGYTDTIQAGEALFFWADLSASKLIEGTFNTLSDAPPSLTNTNLYLPQAKIGVGNYVYVYTGRPGTADGKNYFGISIPSSAGLSVEGTMVTSAGLTVLQAYKIDAKIDDGAPFSGNVTAIYFSTSGSTLCTADHSGTYSDTSASCENMNNVYSINFNSGSGKNCALSFKFQ